jgi:hypothetical protein
MRGFTNHMEACICQSPEATLFEVGASNVFERALTDSNPSVKLTIASELPEERRMPEDELILESVAATSVCQRSSCRHTGASASPTKMSGFPAVLILDVLDPER